MQVALAQQGQYGDAIGPGAAAAIAQELNITQSQFNACLGELGIHIVKPPEEPGEDTTEETIEETVIEETGAGLPDYGFAFNETRDGYLVDETKRRIFREIASGGSVHSVQMSLYKDAIPPPSGRWWTRTFIRECVFDDVYKPHSLEEISELVSERRLSAQVAERLGEGSCGIWWYNRRSLTRGSGGRQRVREKPRAEWIAVPVPDAGVPRAHVEAARKRLSENERPSTNNGRVWPLSGGILRCRSCGRALVAVSTKKQTGKVYYSYVCRTRVQAGPHRCSFRGTLPAPKTEEVVWRAVVRMLKRPEELLAGIRRKRARAAKRRREGASLERQVRALTAEIKEMEEKRARYQDLAADGLMTKDELRAKLSGMDARRKEAERELERLKGEAERESMAMREAETLVESMQEVSEALDGLLPHRHREVYERMGLKVMVAEDKSLELAGEIVDFRKVTVCLHDATSTR